MSILKGKSAKIIEGVIKGVGYLSVFPVAVITAYIILKGVPAISWEFLTGMPEDGMRAGGIFPAIVGSVVSNIGNNSSISTFRNFDRDIFSRIFKR